MTERFGLLDEISYSQLKEVIKRYNSEPAFKEPNGDPLYLETIKKRNVWDNLDRINVDDIINVVLNFLNKWKCRLSYRCAPELQKALQETHILFQLLKDEKLKIENVNFDEIVGTTGKSVKKIIKEIFNTISIVKAGRKTVGFTATTKIMHMIIPNLFVMCDEKIREEYGCAGNSEGHLNFLCRMQKATQRIVREKTKVEICKELHHGDRGFTKILDEYNYYTITWQQQKHTRTQNAKSIYELHRMFISH